MTPVAALMQLPRRVFGGLLKPWNPPEIRATPQMLAAFVALGALNVAVLSVVARFDGGFATADVMLFGCAVVVAHLLRLQDGQHFNSCVDLFYAAAFVLLSPAEAVAVIGIGAASNMVRDESVVRMIVSVGNSVIYTVGLLACTATLAVAGAGPTAAAVLGVLATFLGIRIGEVLLWGVALSVPNRQGTPRPERMAQYRAFIRELVSIEEWVQALVQAPMAVVGVWAFARHPIAIPLLLAPFVVAWRSARQAIRLEAAEREVGIDPLTGLLNRRRFHEVAATELDLARRYGHSLAVFLGDLDNFKRVNDTLGHAVGDEVLQVTAATLRDSLNERLFPIFRYGGEEFVIVVPVLERDQVLQLAEQVRAGICENLAQWQTSISLGVAYLREGEEIEQLLDRADKALYSAKYAGKNRVHEWDRVADKPVAATRRAA